MATEMEHGQRITSDNAHMAMIVRNELLRRLDWSGLTFALHTAVKDTPNEDGSYTVSIQPLCNIRGVACASEFHAHAHPAHEPSGEINVAGLLDELLADLDAGSTGPQSWNEIIVGTAWLEAATDPDGIRPAYSFPPQVGLHRGIDNRGDRYGSAPVPFAEGWFYPRQIRFDDPRAPRFFDF